MKALLALLLCAAACFADVAPPERREPGSRPALRHATVTLVDGSVLHGDLRPRFLPAFSPNLGRIRVDLAKVERIEFETAPGQRDSEAGIRVSPREPGFGFRETRRETRAAPGAASETRRETRAAPGAASETRRETRLPNPESRPSGGCAAGPCGRGGAAPWVPMQSRIAFRNGDRLTVRFPDNLRFLPFDTLLGRVRLPLRAVSSLAIASDETDSLIYHCTFDSASSIEHPAAGPAGTFLGGEFVPGKKGRALLVKARTPAAEVPFPTGLMQPEGCIEFWAKIPGATKETRYPDGGNPMFFAMGVGRWVNTFVKYTANDGFGTGGLHADLPGSAYVSSLPSWGGTAAYPDFLGDPSAWHHYALVWSEKGLDAASEALGRRVVSALYVDGRLVNPAYGTNGPDRARFLRQFTDEPVVLGFPFLRERQDPRQGQVDYLIDEFKIWNFPKTDFAVFTVQPPKLLYHCTFDDGAAIEHPAAGPTGTFLGGEFVPGKKGNALRIPGNVPTALVDLPRGMMQPRGTIEFWSKIENPPASYGDRGNPRFFGLSLFDDSANSGPYSTYLQFTSNDGMGMSGLCGMIYHRAMATDPTMRTNTYGPILEDSAAWHHYAIVWDSDGLSFSKASDGTPAVAAIVLDGRVLQTFGRNQSVHGKGLLRLPELQGKLAFPVADTGWGYFPRPVAFLIDEFKIWSAPVVQTE